MDDYAEFVSVFFSSADIVVYIKTGVDVALHAHTVDVACSGDRLEQVDDVVLL